MKKLKNKECSAMFVCAYLNEVESSPNKHMINNTLFSKGAKHAINCFDRIWGKSKEELDNISIKDMVSGVGESKAEKKAVEQVKYIESFYKSLYKALVESRAQRKINRAKVFAIASETNRKHGILFDLTM